MYLQQKDNGLISLISWDFKENPPWHSVIEAVDKVRKAGYEVGINEIDDFSDDSYILIGPKTLSKTEIKEIFESDWESFFE